MHRIFASLIALVLIAGCSSQPASVSRTPVDTTLFGPVSMRLHPVFTQIRDWTGDNDPDGIEAVIELQDQFGDPTKAAGRIIFELYSYRQFSPDPRGARIAVFDQGRLDSMEDQRARWNRVSRAYIFQLTYSAIKKDQDYVLAATFELAGGGRYFNTLIISGDRQATKSTGPTAIVPGSIITTPKPGATTEPPSTEPSSVPTTDHTPPPRADQP